MSKKSLEQLMIETACIQIGNMIAALAIGDDKKVETLDRLLTSMSAFRPGTPNDDIYRAQAVVAESLRFGADKMLAVHHKARDQKS